MFIFTFILVVLVPLSIFLGGDYLGEHGKMIGAVAAFILSIIISMLIRVLKKWSGETSGSLSDSHPESLWRLREKQSSSIKRAKHLKEKGDYDKATRVLNRVLREDPNCPAALFIKAQILLEKFDNSHAASKHLKQVIIHTSEAIELNEQAVELYKELNPLDAFSGDFVHLVRKKSSI